MTKTPKANRNNRVISIEKDGEYMSVQFERENGEVVQGAYRRIGWNLMPRSEAEDFHRRQALPPKRMYYRGQRDQGPAKPTPATKPRSP